MLEEIGQLLGRYNAKTRAKIVRDWRRIVTPKLRDLAKDISPFSGKTKPKALFGAAPDKVHSKYGAVSIWGVHPNVADDPRYSIPPEGFRAVVPFRVNIGSDRPIWRTFRHAQTHWRTNKLGTIYNRTGFDWVFTYKKRVYGIVADWTEKAKFGDVVPIYSSRSLPELVIEYPELETIIKDAFEEAYQNYMRQR